MGTSNDKPSKRSDIEMRFEIFLVALSAVSAKKFTKKKLVYQIAMREIGTCWMKKCINPKRSNQEPCYSQDCMDCRTDCKVSLTDNQQTWTNIKGVQKTVSNRKFCNLKCKSENRCPKKKDLPKSCKKCKKTCFRAAIENSDAMTQYVSECNTFCDNICWGPNWKTEGCTDCVTQNCAGELFKDEGDDLKN